MIDVFFGVFWWISIRVVYRRSTLSDIDCGLEQSGVLASLISWRSLVQIQHPQPHIPKYVISIVYSPFGCCCEVPPVNSKSRFQHNSFTKKPRLVTGVDFYVCQLSWTPELSSFLTDMCQQNPSKLVNTDQGH